jgi:Miro-like protein.
MYVQAHEVSTILIDSSSKELLGRLSMKGAANHDSQTHEEIKDADVIMLLYDITSKQTVDNLKSYWMPKISKINSRVR